VAQSVLMVLLNCQRFQELFVNSVEYGAKIIIRNGAGGPIKAYYEVTADSKPLPVVDDIPCDI